MPEPAVNQMAVELVKMGLPYPIYLEINGMAGDPVSRMARLLGSSYYKHHEKASQLPFCLFVNAQKESDGCWEVWRLQDGCAHLIRRSYVPGRVGNIKGGSLGPPF